MSFGSALTALGDVDQVRVGGVGAVDEAGEPLQLLRIGERRCPLVLVPLDVHRHRCVEIGGDPALDIAVEVIGHDAVPGIVAPFRGIADLRTKGAELLAATSCTGSIW